MSAVISQRKTGLPTAQETKGMDTLVHSLVDERIRVLRQKGLSGSLNTAWRVAEALLLRRQAHQSVVEALEGHQTRALLQKYPRAVYRYTLPYLSMAVPRARRLDMFRGHYEFLNANLLDGVFERIIQQGVNLWSTRVGEDDLILRLGGPCLETLHREGDLSVQLLVNGEPIAKAAFSVVPMHALPLPPVKVPAYVKHAIYVGQIQGQSGRFEDIKALTKACNDISPLDLLVTGITGFAAALRCEHLVGVSQENNVSFNDETFSVSKGFFNYSMFWEKYSQERNADGDFWISVPVEEKPISQIKANHRRRTLVKRQYKRDMSDAVKASVEHLMRR